MREQRLSKIHFFILLSLFGFVFPLRSQEYKFRTLGVEDGLSQITVSDICQDEKSRIWIATLDGLNCFDGNHIKVFNHFHNDSISYGNLYVTQMVEDGQGSLFLLASTGLFQFDLETEKILYSSGDFSLHSCQRKNGSVDCRRRETVLIR